jgi:hypothetical protein
LTSGNRYHHTDGADYTVGGALVDFLLRKYWSEQFLNLYFERRPRAFEAGCQTKLGMDFDKLEQENWADTTTARQHAR